MKNISNLETSPNQMQIYLQNQNNLIKQLLKELFDNDFITLKQILDNLDEGTLEEYGYFTKKIPIGKINQQSEKSEQQNSQDNNDVIQVPSQQYFKDNYSRYYLQKHIVQEKYNLLREESEGFSKLIVILNRDFTHQLNHHSILSISQNIQQVVHLFNLEVLRVLDIILESFEIQIGKFVESLRYSDSFILSKQEIQNIIKVYQQFIDIFTKDSPKKQEVIASLLGFKLSHILNSELPNNTSTIEQKKIVPYNLILLIAILIREDQILTEDILPYFVKKNKKLIKDEEGKVIEIQFEETADDVETYNLILQNLYQDKYLGLETNILDQNLKIQKQKQFDKELKKAQNLKNDCLQYNYTLWLITCLIQINDFDEAEIIISSFWGDEQLDLSIHKDLLSTLNSYLEAILPPQNDNNFMLFWQKKTKFSQKFLQHSKGMMEFGQENPAEILIKNLQKILRIQHFHIGSNNSLFLRLIENVNRYLIGSNNDVQDEQIKQIAFKISGEYLLPALCLVNENIPKLENELWKIFEKISFQERFKYYQNLFSKIYLQNISMLEKFVELYPRTVKWTKTLSIERDQIELMRNETVKIANGGNSLILAHQIVKICSNYNNLFRALILSMEKQAFNSLALDMVSFCIIKNLSDNQEVYKNIDSEANPPIPLTYITEFASIYYKSFPSVEIMPLIQYVLNRLVDGNHSYEALILSDLIQSMSGWKDLEISQLNEKQLICLAGGIYLKTDIMDQYTEFKKSHSSQKALQNIFYGNQQFYQGQIDINQNKKPLSLAFRLMTNLAKQCQNIIDNFETEDITLIQNFFDKIHQIFVQIVDTVYFINQDQQRYKSIMPNQKDCSKIFIKEYGGILYQYSYYILRRSYKHLGDMDAQELQELTDCYVDIFDCFMQNNIDICKKSSLKTNIEIDNNWSENSTNEFAYFDEEQFQIKKNTDKWKHFSKEIFAIFWQLELQDIEMPVGMYEEQITQKDKAIIIKNKELRELTQQDSDRSKRKLRKEIDGIETIKNDLKQELNQVQKIRFQKTLEFLKNKLPPLFEQIQDESKISHFLIQYCLYPRLMFSPADAVFSIKFLQILVDLKVCKINILNIFAQIMKGIIPTIHCCTNNESENLGVFFMEWFKMIKRWSETNEEGQKIWESECSTYSGFCRLLGQPGIVSQEFFINGIVKPIHQRFTIYLKDCFKNPKKQFMKTKCALKILFRIRSVFPKERKDAKEIQKELSQILNMKKEIQQDIWTLANRYNQNLTEIFPKLQSIESPQTLPTIPNNQNINERSSNQQNENSKSKDRSQINNQKVQQNQSLQQQQKLNGQVSQNETEQAKGSQDLIKQKIQKPGSKDQQQNKNEGEKFQDKEMKNEDRNQNNQTTNVKQAQNKVQNIQKDSEHNHEDSLLGKKKPASTLKQDNVINKKQLISQQDQPNKLVEQSQQKNQNIQKPQQSQTIIDQNQSSAQNNQNNQQVSNSQELNKRQEKTQQKSIEVQQKIQNKTQEQSHRSEKAVEQQRSSQGIEKQNSQKDQRKIIEEGSIQQQQNNQRGAVEDNIETRRVINANSSKDAKIINIDDQQQIQRKEIKKNIENIKTSPQQKSQPQIQDQTINQNFKNQQAAQDAQLNQRSQQVSNNSTKKEELQKNSQTQIITKQQQISQQNESDLTKEKSQKTQENQKLAINPPQQITKSQEFHSKFENPTTQKSSQQQDQIQKESNLNQQEYQKVHRKFENKEQNQEQQEIQRKPADQTYIRDHQDSHNNHSKTSIKKIQNERIEISESQYWNSNQQNSQHNQNYHKKTSNSQLQIVKANDNSGDQNFGWSQKKQKDDGYNYQRNQQSGFQNQRNNQNLQNQQANQNNSHRSGRSNGKQNGQSYNYNSNEKYHNNYNK